MRLNLFLILTALMLAAAPCDASQSKADKIVAMLIDGFGGTGAIMNTVNFHAKGTMSDRITGKEGMYDHYLTRTGNYRADAIFGGRKESRVRAGDSCYSSKGGALKIAQHELKYRIEFEHKSLGLMYLLLSDKLNAEYSGMGFSGGSRYDKLTIYDPSGPAIIIVLDPKTGYVMQTMMDSGYDELGMFKMTFADYGYSGGLTLPYSFKMYIGGELIGEAVIKKYNFDAIISPTMFHK